MKNILILVLITLWLNPTIGITQDSKFEIKFKSEKFTPEVVTDFDKVLAPQLRSTDQAYFYRIIQFNSIPTTIEKQRIEKMGIELLSYIPNKAFFAKLSNSVSSEQLAELNIRSLFAMEDHFKLSPLLTKRTMPEWAIDGNNIKLNVRYFSKADKDKLIEGFAMQNRDVIFQYDEINMLTIEWDKDRINDLAKNKLIQWIAPVSPPSTPHGRDGLSTTRSNALNTEYDGGRKYDGSGVVVGLADDGLVDHIDFHGRVTQHTIANDGNHGDMTAGIFAGAGNLDPTRKAMAPGVDINIYRIAQFIFLNQQFHITEAVDRLNSLGTVITSTSYGGAFDGAYDDRAEFADKQVNETPILLHVYSAGNLGERDSDYGAGPGWGNTSGGFEAAKNLIGVGNLLVNDVLHSTSSRGPSADGRIKPDVCALGDGHLTTDGDNTYQIGRGTSAAAPAVAGAAAQLYQAYKEHNNGANPESGLIKATLLNTADDLGNTGPDFKHGWGRINSLKAVRIIEDNRYFNDNVEQDDNKSHTISVPGNVSQVRIMTYWTDVAGSPTSAVALVNDINMNVVAPDATSYNPWVLDVTPDPALLNAPATRGIDNLNNMEQVTIDNPVAGDYTVNLNGFAIPKGPQSYFVVYDFIYDEVELTYPLGGEGFVPGETERIRWDASTSTEDFDLEYSEDGGNSYINIGTSPASSRRFIWTVPSALSDEVIVRISRGNSISESHTTFTIVEVPSNLNIVSVCPDTVALSWDLVDGVSFYEISMLGEKYMDSIGVSTTNSFNVTGLNPNNEEWFSVRSLVSEGKGRRAIAINKSPGLSNCILNNDIELASVISNLSTFYSCFDLENIEISINLKNLGLEPTSGVNVNYQVNNEIVVTESLPMDLQTGESTDFVFDTNADLSGLIDGEISIWVSMPKDENVFNDTLITPFEIFDNPLISNFPYFEGFELFDNCSTDRDCEENECTLDLGWTNYINLEGDDIDWRTDSGTTPSSDTGPTNDFNIGTSSGKYLYLEGSACIEREAILRSPCIDLSLMNEASVAFAYHMFGENIGELHVDLITEQGEILDIVSPFVGAQGDLWNTLTVDLTPYVGGIVILKIRGTIGGGGFSDIAIDAFTFNASGDPSSTNDKADQAAGISIYPNPTNGDFTIHFPQQLSNQNTHIELIDVLGQRILDIQNTSNNKNVPVEISNLVNGVYFITISGDGYKTVRKLVKN